jgi:formylglycine-generating enzyme required for sulfatase activity
MSYFNKKRFTMRQVVGLLTVVFLGIAVIAYAVSFSDFTSGTTISASEMNAKLNALKDAINRRYTADCAGNSANDIMVKVGSLCVDKYEASIWQNPDGTGIAYGVLNGQTRYPSGFPETGNWTTPLYTVSRAGVKPSTGVTWFQAQQACALSGKRLLTNAEWQMAAAGTPDSTACNVNNPNPDGTITGAYTGCASNYQVNDMVGNVSEWVADWMHGNTNPWAPIVIGTTNATYGSDGMGGVNPATSQGSGQNFPAAIIRGDGVFGTYVGSAPSGTGISHGFRCAR